MIEQSVIQRIFDTAEIHDVVSDFVTLKKRGVNYIGLCPFHNEKTPSFIVSPSKGIYKCFGCGKGGNSVNFVMELEQLSYIEALKYLANKYSIPFEEKEVSPEQQKYRNDRESMMIVSSYANKYFKYCLKDTPEGRAIAMTYFKERGFREDIIEKFELGYCSDAWDGFTKSALDKGYKKEFIIKTGLTIDHEKGLFDRFRSRVIFPIHGVAGKVIAFGGRSIKTDKKIAKYLNSPESDIYHKSRVLYGMYFAKKSIVQHDKCFLVEGYTDVMSFHQSGIDNVVASSGTSLTVEQIRLIKRFSNNVTIVYDGDAAGIKASLRGIDLVLEQGLNVKVLPLPDGEDPDSFAKKHSSTNLINYIKDKEIDFIVFKTQLLLSEAQDDPILKARLINDIVRSVSIIPDSITRSVYIKECSSLLGVEESVLYQTISKIKGSAKIAVRDNTKIEDVSTNKNLAKSPKYMCDLEERMIIRYLLIFGKHIFFGNTEEEKASGQEQISVAEFIISEITSDNLYSDNPLYKLFFEEYSNNLDNKSFIPTKYFRDHINNELSNLAIDIISEPYELSKVWSKNENYVETEDMKLKELVPKVVNEYKEKKVKLMLKDIENKLKIAQEDGDEADIVLLLQQKILFDRLKNSLLKELGNRTIVNK